MKKTLLIPVFFMLLFVGCKKITTEVDSEKPFTLYVLENNTGELVQVPFNRAWGITRPDLADISKQPEGIPLPLNINVDSSLFFFQTDTRIDTIVAYYRRIVGYTKTQFEVFYNIYKLKTSFKHFTRDCISNASGGCDGNEGFLVWGTRPFTIYVVDSVCTRDSLGVLTCKDSLVKNPYERIYDEHGTRIPDISNANNGIQLPLNVQATYAKFYFEKDNKKDSISIIYSTELVKGSRSFKLNFNGLTFSPKTTLSNLLIQKCITNSDDTKFSSCYGTKNFSAAIYR